MLGVVACVAAIAGTVVANCAHGTSAFPRLPNVTVSTFGYDALKGPLKLVRSQQDCEHCLR